MRRRPHLLRHPPHPSSSLGCCLHSQPIRAHIRGPEALLQSQIKDQEVVMASLIFLKCASLAVLLRMCGVRMTQPWDAALCTSNLNCGWLRRRCWCIFARVGAPRPREREGVLSILFTFGGVSQGKGWKVRERDFPSPQDR